MEVAHTLVVPALGVVPLTTGQGCVRLLRFDWLIDCMTWTAKPERREREKGGWPRRRTSEQSRHPNPCQTCVLVWPVRWGARREQKHKTTFALFGHSLLLACR